MSYTNCLDCPDHKIIPDPDPKDRFNDDDLAVVCTKTVNDKRKENSEWVSDRSEFKPVAWSCRPYRTRNESGTPDWCPLVK